MNENRKWMDAIKARDQKCMHCGSTQNLESHHQPSFADLLTMLGIQSRADARQKADKLWSLDHGITLCAECHYTEHGRTGTPPALPRVVEPQECIHCKKIFVVRPSLRRGAWGKCCSRKCVDAMRKHAGSLNPNWRGGKKQVRCLSCDVAFEVKPAILLRGGGRFCNRSCLRRYYNANR